MVNCVSPDPSVAVLPIDPSTGSAGPPVCVVPHAAERTPLYTEAQALRGELRSEAPAALRALAAKEGVRAGAIDLAGRENAAALIELIVNERYRQSKANPHGVCVDQDFVHVADLGINAVVSYRLDDESGLLTQVHEVGFHEGAGPRHVVCAPLVEGSSTRFMFTVNEMDNTVTALQYDGNSGAAQPVQTVSAVPEHWLRRRSELGFHAGYTAEIATSPCGRFVYASHRGYNAIAVFAVTSDEAALALVEFVPTGGACPDPLL